MSTDRDRRVRCAFIRGGTSNGLFFKADDLPFDPSLRDEIFISLMGSPDSYGRQLNGMGGGVSSLSKVAIISVSQHPDADIEYTFGQVAVDQPVVDYSSNCGNLSSAAAPFALDEGMISLPEGAATVRVLNTNTRKIYLCYFEVYEGKCKEAGEFDIPGVTGSGAEIKLEYPDPGGAVTGCLLPTGKPLDQIDVSGVGGVEVSIVDASNPVVFVDAGRFGLVGTEHPDDIDQNTDLMDALESIRRHCALLMGLASDARHVGIGTPKVALIGAAAGYSSLAGDYVSANDTDLSMRIISVGRAHKVVTLTGAVCAAVAAKIKDTLVYRRATQHHICRIGTPSGPRQCEIAE